MLDLDRFIIELDELITAVYFYDELYCNDEAINVINSISRKAFNIIRLSLHNDIIMSTSNLIFDTKDFKAKDNNGNKKVYEYLSLYNLVTEYDRYMDDDLRSRRKKIKELKDSLNIDEYRNFVLAHNDKAILTGRAEHPKHKLETSSILELLQESRVLIYEVRLKLALENREKSLPIGGCNIVRSGVGLALVNELKKITNKNSQRIINVYEI